MSGIPMALEDSLGRLASWYGGDDDVVAAHFYQEFPDTEEADVLALLASHATEKAAREAAETKLGEALHALGGAVLAFKRAGLHEVDLPLDAAVARQIARAEAAEKRVGELEADIFPIRVEKAKAEAALGPLQARVTGLEADLTIRVELAESKAEGRLLEMLLAYTASPETWPAEDYVVFRQFRYAIEKARKKAEAALAPLQAMVDEARKVIEPFAKAHAAATDPHSNEGAWVFMHHLQAAAAWLKATPTGLLNSRLAEVWEEGREAAIQAALDVQDSDLPEDYAFGAGHVAHAVRALPNPYRKPEEPGT